MKSREVGATPERRNAREHFNRLSTEYGEDAVIAVIEEVTEISPKVITSWLLGERPLSSGLVKRVLGCLRDPTHFSTQRAGLSRAPKSNSPPALKQSTYFRLGELAELERKLVAAGVLLPSEHYDFK